MHRGVSAGILLGFLTLVETGCGGGTLTGPRTPSEGRPVAVSEDAFPDAVRDLLLSKPGSKDERSRLRAVEERQMLRAAAAFNAHSTERGLASVRGGINLVRIGEMNGLLTPAARGALVPAVRELAQRGDEGGSTALYNLWLGIATPAEKKDIAIHLDALKQWAHASAMHPTATEKAGAAESVAVARVLLEPTDEARADAEKKIKAWVEDAVRYVESLKARGVNPRDLSPDERFEAARAFQTSASILAALRLREGDVTGALGALEDARAREFPIDGRLYRALQKVGESADGGAWLTLLQALRPHGRDGEEPDGGGEIDSPDILKVAAFGVAREAYRSDPSTPESAGALAVALQAYGMADASPAVMVEAAKKHPDPGVLGEALALSMHAIATEVEAGDTDGARRAFKASLPLLQIADGKELAGKVQPSPAHLRAMMGEIELHDGHVDEAKKLFVAAVKQEPLGGVVAALARIDRATGNPQAAQAKLQQALTTPDVQHDAALHGEVLLAQSDLLREAGDVNAARVPLTEALKLLAQARTTPDNAARARVERSLSRVLDRFGATKLASAALARALDATPKNKDEIAATLGILVSQALVHNDLKAAQDGLRHGLAADLGDDDLVYLALWTRAVEKQMKAPSDGDAEKVFAQISDDGRWVGRLAAFGAGKLKAADLIASAKTPAQRTEALFYAGLEKRSAGDVASATALFQQALKAGGVDLMEIALARDILEGPKAYVGGPVPEVGLP